MNNLDGHKTKKPTKKQMLEEVIPSQLKQELHNAHIKGLVQGFEVANQMILDYIKSGKNLDEVVSFIEKNLSKEGKDAMMKVVIGGKE